MQDNTQQAKNNLFKYLMERTNNVISEALLGKQEQPTDNIEVNNAAALKGVDTTTPEYKENMAGAPVNITVSENPRKGGLLPDLLGGYSENASTPFQFSNFKQNQLADGRNKGAAYKFGEFAGTAARLLDNPLVRGAITYGISKRLGDTNPLEQALTATNTTTQNKLNDTLYRQELAKRGVNPEGLRGWVSDTTFKNLSTTAYRNRNLDQTTYTKLRKLYDEQLKNGTLSPEEYQQNMRILNENFLSDQIRVANSGRVGKSNDTRRVNIAEMIAPHTIENLDARTGYYKNGGGKSGKAGKAGSPIGTTNTPPQKVKVKFEGRTYLVDHDKLDKYIAEGAEVI